VTGCAVEPPRPALVPGPADAPFELSPPLIVSRFGERRGEGSPSTTSRHAGIDIRSTTGTPVLAAADGVVLRTGWQAFAGRLIVIEHDADLATAYYHLSAVGVAAGQAVRRGDVIGRVGMTGNATAPHLHFGVCRRDGGLCGDRIEAGWDDPTRHWIAANPCFVAGYLYPPEDRRFTFPVPCQLGPATELPLERAPGPPLARRSALPAA
jgi:murein DD-endopeptidase MepM/ murein hydrolase activator NlpD